MPNDYKFVMEQVEKFIILNIFLTRLLLTFIGNGIVSFKSERIQVLIERSDLSE